MRTAIILVALALALFAYLTGMDFYKGLVYVLFGTPLLVGAGSICVLGVAYLIELVRDRPEEAETGVTKELPVTKRFGEHMKDFGLGFGMLPLGVLALGPFALIIQPITIKAMILIAATIALSFQGFAPLAAMGIATLGTCFVGGVAMTAWRWSLR